MTAPFTKEQRKLAKQLGKPLARLQYEKNVGDKDNVEAIDLSGPVDPWVVDEINKLITKWLDSKKKKRKANE